MTNLNKIDEFEKLNNDSIFIISDFNKTLTLKECTTSFSVFRKKNYLSKEYRKLSQAMFDKYYPIESKQIKTSEIERLAVIALWWKEHLELLIESNLTKDIIEDIINNKYIEMKENSNIFFNFLEDKDIPILIYSAGIGNIVKEAMIKKNLFPKSNIEIFSNFFNFDNKTKKTISFTEPVIDVCNKNSNFLKDLNFYDKIKTRKNVILIGDSLTDLNMQKGLEYDKILKIALFGINKDNDYYTPKREEFERYFDIVLDDDGDLKQLIEIFKKIFN